MHVHEREFYYMYQGVLETWAVVSVCRTVLIILLKHIQLSCLVTFAFSEYSVDITL